MEGGRWPPFFRKNGITQYSPVNRKLVLQMFTFCFRKEWRVPAGPPGSAGITLRRITLPLLEDCIERILPAPACAGANGDLHPQRPNQETHDVQWSELHAQDDFEFARRR